MSSKNRFEGLNVEEAAALADEEDPADELLPEVSKVEFEEEGDSEDEFWVAVSLLLQEQLDMEEIVREHWQKYNASQVDLMVAAMVTDTALKLAQNAEAQFDFVIQRPAKYPASQFPLGSLPAVLYYNNNEEMHKWPVTEIANPSQILGKTVDTRNGSGANYDFWPVYAGLKYFVHKHMNRKNPHQVVQMLPQDFRDLAVHERTLRALECAQIMRLITVAPIRTTLWDMVSEGLQEMFKMNQIPTWLTFGVQLHLDIQDILGDDQKRAHFELQVYLNGLIDSVQELDKWKDPFLRDNIQQECYVQVKKAYNDISPWANYDGFAEQ